MARAAKACGTHGCPNFAPCADHAPQPWAGSTRRQRLPRGWDKLRRSILRRDPICKACHFVLSAEVDHVVPGDDHSPSNLQGLCAPCHAEKTQAEAARARRTP